MGNCCSRPKSKSLYFENQYSMNIEVKIEVQRSFTLKREIGGEGGLGFGGANLTGGWNQMQQAEWNKVKPDYTTVRPGHSVPLGKNIKGDLFLSVVTDDGSLNIRSWQIDTYTCWRIAADGELERIEMDRSSEANVATNPLEPDANAEPQDREQKKQQEDAQQIKEQEEKQKHLELQKQQDEAQRLKEDEEKQKQLGLQRYSMITGTGEQASSSGIRSKLSTKSAMKTASIDVKIVFDREDCCISEMTVTPGGVVLMTDSYNNKIKCVPPDENISFLDIRTKPMAITVLDTTTAVVSGEDKKLYTLDISDPTKLSVRSECQLEYGIRAMIIYNDKLVVTCDTDPRCTKMITSRGQEVWSEHKNESGENLFSNAHGITTTTINDIAVIVVTDFDKNTLTLLEAETGRFIRTIDVGQWKSPWGITVDNDGNVYVCYGNTHEICVWSNDFKESKILMSRSLLEAGPCRIVYNGVNDSLYVSYGSLSPKANTVDCFSLSKIK